MVSIPATLTLDDKSPFGFALVRQQAQQNEAARADTQAVNTLMDAGALLDAVTVQGAGLPVPILREIGIMQLQIDVALARCEAAGTFDLGAVTAYRARKCAEFVAAFGATGTALPDGGVAHGGSR